MFSLLLDGHEEWNTSGVRMLQMKQRSDAAMAFHKGMNQLLQTVEQRYRHVQHNFHVNESLAETSCCFQTSQATTVSQQQHVPFPKIVSVPLSADEETDGHTGQRPPPREALFGKPQTKAFVANPALISSNIENAQCQQHRFVSTFALHDDAANCFDVCWRIHLAVMTFNLGLSLHTSQHSEANLRQALSYYESTLLALNTTHNCYYSASSDDDRRVFYMAVLNNMANIFCDLQRFPEARCCAELICQEMTIATQLRLHRALNSCTGSPDDQQLQEKAVMLDGDDKQVFLNAWLFLKIEMYGTPAA